MSQATFEVIQPGIFSTVQDLGRRGHLASGIPPSGAMDRSALRLGNLLVQNPQEEAGLEMTAQGLTLRALQETVVALTGGRFESSVNGNPVPGWETVPLRPGDLLAIGRALSGWRGYLCVAGGIDVPQVLGSKSTYTLGGLGGVRGRVLKKGDLLEVGVPRAALEVLKGRKAKKGILPQPGEEKVLRVILGPQDDHVKEESVACFLNSDYRVSIRANRVGYRFEGPQLYFKERAESRDAGLDPSNIVDEGNAIGAIQIPAGKEPICLGVDGVTMGGYVKIACLIAADMDRMAQLPLRETVRFQSVTVEEARSILEASLGRIKEENIIRS